jgi:hypothetical protein
VDHEIDARGEAPTVAVEAALVLGLDVAGVDFVASDIRTPIAELGGAVIEVNAGPGFRMHLARWRRRTARRRRSTARFALPARCAQPHPHRGRDRDQR